MGKVGRGGCNQAQAQYKHEYDLGPPAAVRAFPAQGLMDCRRQRDLLGGNTSPVAVNPILEVQDSQPSNIHIQQVVVKDILEGKRTIRLQKSILSANRISATKL